MIVQLCVNHSLSYASVDFGLFVCVKNFFYKCYGISIIDRLRISDLIVKLCVFMLLLMRVISLLLALRENNSYESIILKSKSEICNGYIATIDDK